MPESHLRSRLSWRLAPFVCACAALAVGCDGRTSADPSGDAASAEASSNTGGTGAEGSGGSPDASAGTAGASSGGTGGSLVIDAGDFPDVDPVASAACKTEYDQQTQQFSCVVPCVGFSSQAPEVPESAIITAVSPELLEVTLASDGTAWKFAWIGDDLTQWFHFGEPVQIGGGDPYGRWHWVTSDKHVAATYHLHDFIGPKALPSFGPKLALVPQCAYVMDPGCGNPPVVNTVLAVEAATATESVVIANGESGAVGEWLVMNAQSHQASGFKCGPDTADDVFTTTVTVLGPVTDGGA